ncbi:hypothetical protein, partial [Rhodoplanes azumiensis]
RPRISARTDFPAAFTGWVRIGQERPVTIHVLLATHPEFRDASFDVTLEKLLRHKRELSRHMLAPPVQESDIDMLFGSAISGTPSSDPSQ